MDSAVLIEELCCCSLPHEQASMRERERLTIGLESCRSESTALSKRSGGCDVHHGSPPWNLLLSRHHWSFKSALASREAQMLYSAFGSISLFKAARQMAGNFAGGSARARTFAAVMLVAVFAGNSAYAASSDDVDQMLGAVSAPAVKLRKCYERSLDMRAGPDCEMRDELIKSAERSCGFEEADLKRAIIKSATAEQRSSILSLTADVLDAVLGPLKAKIVDDAHRELPFSCFVKRISR
jgi:hypothetical protein